MKVFHVFGSSNYKMIATYVKKHGAKVMLPLVLSWECDALV